MIRFLFFAKGNYTISKPRAGKGLDFPSLRKDGKIYVDKTMFMHRLVTDKNARLFFMSRPRRFGKSLTVSAFKAYTLGVPDEEIRRDFCTLLAGMAANNSMSWAASLGKKLLGAKWDAAFV